MLTLVYVKFIVGMIPEANRSWGFTLIFLMSLAASFLVYRYLMRFLLKKVEVEKFFDPLFVRKSLRKNKAD
jgi:hypothetical protein